MSFIHPLHPSCLQVPGCNGQSWRGASDACLLPLHPLAGSTDLCFPSPELFYTHTASLSPAPAGSTCFARTARAMPSWSLPSTSLARPRLQRSWCSRCSGRFRRAAGQALSGRKIGISSLMKCVWAGPCPGGRSRWAGRLSNEVQVGGPGG